MLIYPMYQSMLVRGFFVSFIRTIYGICGPKLFQYQTVVVGNKCVDVVTPIGLQDGHKKLVSLMPKDSSFWNPT